MTKFALLRKSWFLVIFLFVFIPTSVHAVSQEEVQFLLDNYYVNELNDDIYNQDSVEDIIDDLDPYSSYFSQEEYSQFMQSINRNYTGIGVAVEATEKGIIIIQLFNESPAEDVGIQVGDIVIEVDGTTLEGKSIEESTSLVKGKTGTKVQLRIHRPSTEEEFTVNVERKEIHMPTVEYAKLGGDIGYVRLYSFNETASEELRDALLELGNVNGWIVDLRDNGGGLLDAAQEIAGMFPNVEHALIVETRTDGKKAHKAMKQTHQFTEPTSLLVNEYSASASEIVAGAVQDYNSATLYGQTTFGKGLAQSIFQLNDGSALKMSVANFYTPKGNTIHEVGVTPDVKTEVGQELEKAHRDLLVQDAEKLDELVDVVRQPVFSIKASSAVLASQIEEAVKLVEIGRGEVEVEIKPEAFDRFIVEPKQTLRENTKYVLILEMGQKRYYVDVTTSEEMGEGYNSNVATFTDVKNDQFFADPVALLAKEAIIEGVGNNRFAPFYYLNRQDAVVMFSRALELDLEDVKEPGFTDVKKNTYYYPHIAAMKEFGIIQGKSLTYFGIDDILTREQMAGLISRAFNLEKQEEKVPFKDIEKSYFKNDIMSLYQSGIAQGYAANIYGPYKAVTRGEFATFLYRALVNDNQGEFTIEAITVEN